jgi:hypothetical protein
VPGKDGSYGLIEVVTVIVKSGNPGGERHEFMNYMADALSAWYGCHDGGRIYMSVEENE